MLDKNHITLSIIGIALLYFAFNISNDIKKGSEPEYKNSTKRMLMLTITRNNKTEEPQEIKYYEINEEGFIYKFITEDTSIIITDINDQSIL